MGGILKMSSKKMKSNFRSVDAKKMTLKEKREMAKLEKSIEEEKGIKWEDSFERWYNDIFYFRVPKMMYEIKDEIKDSLEQFIETVPDSALLENLLL